jgi:heavy metal translocating P-type ATPase
MLFGLAANTGHPEGSVRWAIHGALAISAFLVLWLLGRPLFREACTCAGQGRWAVEWLFLLGIGGAMGASVHATVTGSGAVYYDVVAVLLTVYATGKALTAAARSRAVQESQRLAAVFGTANLIREGGEVLVPVGQLQAGDRIRVPIGGSIPADGRVVSGVAHVQEGLLSGELMPVVRRVGDSVLAGGMTVDGFLELEVGPAGGRRRLDRVLQALQEARADLADTAAQRLTDGITRWFLPFVLVVAAATAAVWGLRGDWSRAVYHSLSVILVACPCALGLATPLALWNGLALLAARGISLKSASALERLARVRSVWFDKSGTLTRPHPVLTDFVCSGDGRRRQELLSWVAALERQSSHPLAAAFQEAGLTATVEVGRVAVVPGVGIEGTACGQDGIERHVRVGSPDRGGIEGSAPAWVGELKSTRGDQLVAVWVDGVWSGLGAVRLDPVREWDGVVSGLQALGCRVGILSGAAASSLTDFQSSRQVEAHGDLFPEDKVEFIRGLQQRGETVLFVGDGINDALALQEADVGLAVGSGAALARERADGEIGRFEPALVLEALRVGRLVHRRIRNGLWFAAFYNLTGMALAASGRLHPVLAAILMVGSSSMVTWQAVRGATRDCEGDAGRGGWDRWLVPASLTIQIAMLGWLGALSWGTWSAVAVGLGTLAVWRLSDSGSGRVGKMTWSMLGPGNLLMLVGWWVDAGFGPVMREGVCLCCQSHRYFEVGWKIPWMWIGMIAGGLPWMWRSLPDLGAGGNRWVAAVLSSAGMIVGMNQGADLILQLAGPGHPQQFVLAWLGMTVGMFAGMGFGCGLAEALRIAVRR